MTINVSAFLFYSVVQFGQNNGLEIWNFLQDKNKRHTMYKYTFRLRRFGRS